MPRRLLSFTMLANYAKAFTMLAADIERVRYQLMVEANQDGSHLTMASPRVQRFHEHMRTLLATCEQVPQLYIMRPPIGRMIASLEDGVDAIELHHSVDNLVMLLMDQLDLIQLFHVPPHMVDAYNNPMPFGQAVFDRFPAANNDIASAGQCLALGQPTASVFHLMRVCEAGLIAVGLEAGIPYAPSWESYILQLNAKLKVPYKDKTKAWKKKEPFLKEVLGDITAMKFAWRNPTMHIVNSYDMEQAQQIYLAVRSFMVTVSGRLAEPKRFSPSPVGVEAQP